MAAGSLLARHAEMPEASGESSACRSWWVPPERWARPWCQPALPVTNIRTESPVPGAPVQRRPGLTVMLRRENGEELMSHEELDWVPQTQEALATRRGEERESGEATG